MPSGSRSFARSVQNRQRQPYLIAARVDGTGTAAILAGSTELTLTDNGTGDYTLTFGIAFQRAPIVVASPLSTTGDVICTLHSTSTTIARLKFWDATDGTTAKDAIFHVMIMGYDAADEV